MLLANDIMIMRLSHQFGKGSNDTPFYFVLKTEHIKPQKTPTRCLFNKVGDQNFLPGKTIESEIIRLP